MLYIYIYLHLLFIYQKVLYFSSRLRCITMTMPSRCIYVQKSNLTYRCPQCNSLQFRTQVTRLRTSCFAASWRADRIGLKAKLDQTIRHKEPQTREKGTRNCTKICFTIQDTGKVQVNLSLCLTTYETMKTYSFLS